MTMKHRAEVTRAILSDSRALPTMLEGGLDMLRCVQENVSGLVPGAVPDGPPSKDALRTYALALVVEAAEFLQTLDWKPWKNPGKAEASAPDRERTADEFADILAFLGVLIVYLERMGLTPKDLAQAYMRKSVVNVDRFLGAISEEYRQEGLK